MKSTGLTSYKIKIFKDKRGITVFPIGSSALSAVLRKGKVEDLHIVTLKPGAVRGNHLHPEHDEYILCIGKGLKLSVIENGKREEIGADATLIKIGRGKPHAIVNSGAEKAFVLCFYGPHSGSKLEKIPIEVV